MYLVDLAAYRQDGAPITGADYFHYHKGPVPSQIQQCYNRLVAKGDIKLRRRRHILGDFLYPRVISKLPKTTLLAPHHHALFHQAIDLFKHRTPQESTDLLRHDPGWSITRTGEA